LGAVGTSKTKKNAAGARFFFVLANSWPAAAMEAQPTRRRRADDAAGPAAESLLSLNDDLLLAVLSHIDPLPHRFLLGRTCKRLHALVASDALRLIVSPSAAAAGEPGTARTPRPACRAAFPTVAAAVAASRPGDTVVIEAGRTHACAGVVLAWPVRLVGGVLRGGTGTATTASCPMPTLAADTDSSTTILDVRASALLAGLRVVGPAAGGPCVTHRAGALRIVRCSLQGAVGGGTRGRRGVRGVTAPPVLPSAASSSPILSTAGDAGRDCVVVEETRVAGLEHARAARLLHDSSGGAAVTGVRVVPLSGAGGDLFWLRLRPVPPPVGAGWSSDECEEQHHSRSRLCPPSAAWTPSPWPPVGVVQEVGESA
jgi:hypothetical protein